MRELKDCSLMGHSLFIKSDYNSQPKLVESAFKTLMDYYKFPHCDKTPAEKAEICGTLDMICTDCLMNRERAG